MDGRTNMSYPLGVYCVHWAQRQEDL